MKHLLALVALTTACANDGAATPAPSAPPKERNMEPLQVDWKLTRDDAHEALALTYTVTNMGTVPVVVLDQLTSSSAKGTTLEADRVVVRSADATTVSFVRGYVKPDQPIGGVFAPGARTLAPGEHLGGSATIPLPLTAWHNFQRNPAALSGTATKAVFEIGYLIGHDKWGEATLKDGTKLRVPNPPYIEGQRFATGAILTLP